MKKEKRSFNFSNKLAYTLIAVVVLVFLGMGVYAVVVPGTSGNPGHSIQSIGAPAGCTPGQFLRLALDGTWGCSPTSCNAGQVLTYNGDATWSCTTPVTGGTTLPSCTTGQYLQKTSTGWGCFTPPNYGCYPHIVKKIVGPLPAGTWVDTGVVVLSTGSPSVYKVYYTGRVGANNYNGEFLVTSAYSGTVFVIANTGNAVGLKIVPGGEATLQISTNGGLVMDSFSATIVEIDSPSYSGDNCI